MQAFKNDCKTRPWSSRESQRIICSVRFLLELSFTDANLYRSYDIQDMDIQQLCRSWQGAKPRYPQLAASSQSKAITSRAGRRKRHRNPAMAQRVPSKKKVSGSVKVAGYSLKACPKLYRKSGRFSAIVFWQAVFGNFLHRLWANAGMSCRKENQFPRLRDNTSRRSNSANFLRQV